MTRTRARRPQLNIAWPTDELRAAVTAEQAAHGLTQAEIIDALLREALAARGRPVAAVYQRPPAPNARDTGLSLRAAARVLGRTPAWVALLIERGDLQRPLTEDALRAYAAARDA